MLAVFRNFSKSWGARLLIGLLIVAFAVWGISDAFRATGNTDIVLKAGEQELTRADFKREFDGQKEEIEQRNQRRISQDEAVANGMDVQLLTMLGQRASVEEVLRKLGVGATDELISKALAKEHAFYDPITGKFDRKIYESLLAQNNLTPAVYEKSRAAEIAQKHGLGALGFGLRPPRVYGAVQAVYAFQERDVQFFAVDASKVAKPQPPTDAQLTAFLKEHASQVMRPEFRQLTIVRFSSKALASGLVADPAELQRLFDYRKDQLSTPETRSLVQVTVKDQATAATASARIAKGEDPAVVAKSVGGQLVRYDNKPKTAIADPTVADAAFALASGQTSGAVKGSLSYAVVKVLGVTAGKTVDFAALRPQLEEEARARAAERKISETADAFEKAYAGGANMVEAAKTVGLTAITTAPVTAGGAALDGKPATGLSPKLLETAFKLPEGGDSEVTEDQRGEYFIVRVEKVTPPALPTINEIRGPLTAEYVSQEAQSLLKAKAEELAARVRKGESLEAVAASIGASAVPLTGLSQFSARQQAATLGAPLIGAALNAKAGEVVVAQGGAGLVVLKVAAVKNGDATQMAAVVDQARAQVANQLLEEYRNQIGVAATGAVKLQVHRDRAQSALGIEPTPAADAKSKGKAG